MTSILLKSNAATLLMALLLWLSWHSGLLMVLWLFLATGYLLLMLHWLVVVDAAQQSLVPSDERPMFPKPLQFIGGSEREGGEL